jgi:hypothetical protein
MELPHSHAKAASGKKDHWEKEQKIIFPTPFNRLKIDFLSRQECSI